MAITPETKQRSLLATGATGAAAAAAIPATKAPVARVAMAADAVKLKSAPKPAPKAEEPSFWTRAVNGLSGLAKKAWGYLALAMCMDWMRATDREIEKEDQKKQVKAAHEAYVDSVQRSHNAEAKARAARGNAQ